MSNNYTSDYIFKVADYVSRHEDSGVQRAWRGIRHYEGLIEDNSNRIEATERLAGTAPDLRIMFGSFSFLPSVAQTLRMLKHERQRIVNNNRERQKFFRSVIDFANNAGCVEDHIRSVVNGHANPNFIYYREPMETPKWKRICTDEQLKRAFCWCKDEKYASYPEVSAENHPVITMEEIQASKPIKAMVYAGAFHGKRYHQGNPIPLLVMLTLSIQKVTVSLSKDMLGEPVWCLGCPSRYLGQRLPAGWFPVYVKAGD